MSKAVATKTKPNYMAKVEFATKHDIDLVRKDVDLVRKELKHDIDLVRKELKHDIDLVRKELKYDIDLVRKELKHDIDFVREELKHDIDFVREELKHDISLLRKDINWLKWGIPVLIGILLWIIFGLKADIREINKKQDRIIQKFIEVLPRGTHDKER